jgi:Clostripain family
MPTTTHAKSAWTFMVYMAGDNDLDPNGVIDLREMKKVGSTPQLNIIAQFDREAGAKRYYLRKGGKVTADAVDSLKRTNTGDPKILADFIKWGVKTYPARHYMLVLWNHGQGWDDTDIYADERHRRLRRLASGRVRHALFHTPVRRTLAKAARDPEARAILLDDNAKDFLDNLEMKKVLAGAKTLLKRKLDVLGMDACLMSMAEVGYQIRDSTDFTVGSEETEPLDGWPYHTILAELAKSPRMTPRDLSALIVTKYLASYSSDSVTQSACDLGQATALATAVKHLAATLESGLVESETVQRILAARTRAQAYDVKDNIDLVDFCTLLMRTGGPEIASQCGKLISAIQSGAYVVEQGSKGGAVKNSHGVSIYFPTDTISPLYAGLDFAKQTGWGTFLHAYLAAVKRR